MVGESLTTKLARERLAAIKKFIPVRDRLREKLQQRQQAQTDFSVSSEQLFTPITSATKDVKTATERAIYGDIPKEGKRREVPVLGVLEKIAAETGQTRAGIQQLSSDIKTQREYERLADIDDSAPETQPVDVVTPRGVSFIDKLTEGAIAEIKRPQLIKPEHYKIFGNFAAQSFHSRKDFLKDEYKNSRISRDEWADWLYKTNRGVGRLNKRELGYKEFRKGIDEYDETGTTEKTSGKGYSIRNLKDVFDSTVTCPGNILSDISRLEVLIGGKRAGNNSPEVINEAADICRRLFAGGIMDIDVYRELIAELVENHNNDNVIDDENPMDVSD